MAPVLVEELLNSVSLFTGTVAVSPGCSVSVEYRVEVNVDPSLVNMISLALTLREVSLSVVSEDDSAADDSVVEVDSGGCPDDSEDELSGGGGSEEDDSGGGGSLVDGSGSSLLDGGAVGSEVGGLVIGSLVDGGGGKSEVEEVSSEVVDEEEEVVSGGGEVSSGEVVESEVVGAGVGSVVGKLVSGSIVDVKGEFFRWGKSGGRGTWCQEARQEIGKTRPKARRNRSLTCRGI